MRFILLTVFLGVFGTAAAAQKPRVAVEPVFLGPAPTAVLLPAPLISGKKIDTSGVISVGVSVDESGTVTVTDQGEGPYPVCQNIKDEKILALRALAVSAAKNSKFASAAGLARPAIVQGRINYTFDPAGKGGPASTKKDEAVGAVVDGAKSESGTAGTAGILNHKAADSAISTPRPVYPAAAKAVRAGGPVQIQALIAEDGTMHSAQAISGHPLLRRTAELAACSARFAPTLLSGKPVKVSGIITYNFVP
jgi:hypothetical protein